MHACNINIRVARSHDDLRESLTSCINFSYQLTVYSIVNLNASNINNNLIMHNSVKFVQNPWLHSLMYIYYWSTSRAASTPGQGCNLISDGRMMYSAQKPVTSYVRRLRSAFVSQKVSSMSWFTVNTNFNATSAWRFTIVSKNGKICSFSGLLVNFMWGFKLLLWSVNCCVRPFSIAKWKCRQRIASETCGWWGADVIALTSN